jgi:hypothetical protein
MKPTQAERAAAVRDMAIILAMFFMAKPVVGFRATVV